MSKKLKSLKAAYDRQTEHLGELEILIMDYTKQLEECKRKISIDNDRIRLMVDCGVFTEVELNLFNEIAGALHARKRK